LRQLFSTDLMANLESCFTTNEYGSAFKCSKCNTISKLYIPHKLQIFACPKCGKIHSREDFDQYLKIPNQKATYLKYFKIGTVGKFEGVKYTVIGQANKHVTHRYADKWDEILLLSETGEISFLNCSYGNYTWVKEDHMVQAHEILSTIESTFKFQDREYEFLQGYNYVSKYCIGEFHYNVIDVKKIKCFDYISPPYMISIEKHDNGRVDTFTGRHMTRKQISDMFNDYRIESQEKEGIGIAQPVLGGINVRLFNKVCFALIGCIILTSILFSINKSYREIFHENIPVSGTVSPSPDFVSKSFYIDSNSTNNYLEFTTTASLSNEWIEAALTLIDEATGEEREFGVVSEYYSGVDNGYSWAEGSGMGTVGVSSVPGGRYHLKATIYSSVTSDQNLYLEVKYGSTEVWNTLIIALPLLVILIIINLLKHRYELMRKGEIDNLFESKA
jgi:phage FluMu protein Com